MLQVICNFYDLFYFQKASDEEFLNTVLSAEDLRILKLIKETPSKKIGIVDLLHIV